MQLNLERFEELIETYAAERWKTKIDDWELRLGGGETFVQRDVIGKANPLLSQAILEKSAKETGNGDTEIK